MSDVDTLSVLKLLAKGRPPAFVATALGLREFAVQSIANAHGWPDTVRIEKAAAKLMLASHAAAIPVREPEPSRPPLSLAPTPRPGTPPATGGTPNGVAKTPQGVPPAPTVEELVRACRRSEFKRTQALGPKLTELAERITTALRAEREAAEAKAKQAEEFAAKKAAVDRLAKQLAAAKAELSKLKPTGVTEAALDFACADCGDVFSTSAGRKRHATRKHTPPTEEYTA